MRHSKIADLLILKPLSWIYGMVTAVRNKLFDWHIFKQHTFPVPVLVIGNLAVGVHRQDSTYRIYRRPVAQGIPYRSSVTRLQASDKRIHPCRQTLHTGSHRRRTISDISEIWPRHTCGCMRKPGKRNQRVVAADPRINPHSTRRRIPAPICKAIDNDCTHRMAPPGI